MIKGQQWPTPPCPKMSREDSQNHWLSVLKSSFRRSLHSSRDIFYFIFIVLIYTYLFRSNMIFKVFGMSGSYVQNFAPRFARCQLDRNKYNLPHFDMKYIWQTCATCAKLCKSTVSILRTYVCWQHCKTLVNYGEPRGLDFRKVVTNFTRNAKKGCPGLASALLASNSLPDSQTSCVAAEYCECAHRIVCDIFRDRIVLFYRCFPRLYLA